MTISQPNFSNRTVIQVTAIPLTASRFLLPLAQALRQNGYSVHFATGAGAEQETIRAAGFPVHTIAITRRFYAPVNFLAFLQLVALLRQQRCQIMHAHTPVAGLLGRLAARLAGVPIILYTLHGTAWDQGTWLRTRLYTLAEWLGSSVTDRVFVLNDQDERELIERKYYKPSQITNLGVGGSGINLQRFDPQTISDETRNHLRQTFGIPYGAPVIGYLGRTVREKGILELLQAFVLIQRQIPSAQLVIAGGAVIGEWDAIHESDIMTALSGRRDLRQQVHLTGFREDVPALLSLMDVVVLPSWREGFGMALAEAGAMGLPVVATRTRGGQRAVVHGETGFLVPLHQPKLLAAALTTILTYPTLAQRMGEAGRQRAIAHFSQEQTIARQLAVYREM